MHKFDTLAGSQLGCIPISVKTKDDKFHMVIDIAKTTCKDRIMLFRKYDNKLTLLDTLDIIDELTCFFIVNINDRTLKSCAID